MLTLVLVTIKSRVLAKEPNVVVVAGCPCHMLHNAAAKGPTAFADATGFDLEDHCVDLFYWFDKSTKRKGILKEYCMFCDTEYEAVVKYVWQMALSRALLGQRIKEIRCPEVLLSVRT